LRGKRYSSPLLKFKQPLILGQIVKKPVRRGGMKKLNAVFGKCCRESLKVILDIDAKFIGFARNKIWVIEINDIDRITRFQTDLCHPFALPAIGMSIKKLWRDKREGGI
jgi:hypothetical protein